MLATLRNKATIRRNAPTVILAALAVTAGVTAYVLVNWAAVDGLSTTWHGWRAPLALAVAWLLVAVVAAVLVYRRSSMTFSEAEAEAQLRATLEELAEAVAGAAREQIAAAILPIAGGVVEAGEEMVYATDDVIEAADEITDVLQARLPGGVVVNRAFDLVLVPGKFGVRVARVVLKVGQEPGESKSG